MLEAADFTFMNGKKGIGRKKRRKESFKKKSVVVVLLAVVVILGLFFYFSLRSLSNQTSEVFQFEAAIVDNVGLTFPNQTFIERATTILKEAGFTVDYCPGENVTVDFYRNLPTHGYGLIILRVHSDVLALFTSEPYNSTQYTYEQSTDQLAIAAYSEDDLRKGNVYFGIRPSFITKSMNGRFVNTIILMMGCEGLTDSAMAEAFVKKGAKVYISWSGLVSATHTDQASVELLKHLITEKQAIKQAITETMEKVGPDPVDGSILLCYPDTLVDDYVIPNLLARRES